MTKTELKLALGEAIQTNKKTAGVFLDTLSALVYKTIKKNSEFVLPGFGHQTEEEGALESQDAKEDQESSQNRAQIRSRQGRKGRSSRIKKVIRRGAWPEPPR